LHKRKITTKRGENVKFSIQFFAPFRLSSFHKKPLELIPNKFSYGQISGTGKVLDTIQCQAFWAWHWITRTDKVLDIFSLSHRSCLAARLVFLVFAFKKCKCRKCIEMFYDWQWFSIQFLFHYA